MEAAPPAVAKQVDIGASVERYYRFPRALDAFLKAEGALAYVAMTRVDGKLVMSDSRRYAVGDTPPLPGFGMAVEDYRRLVRLAEFGEAPTLEIDSLVHYDSGISSLNGMLGHDVSGYDPDAPLPEIPETNASKSARERILRLARDEKLTIRQLAQKAGSYSGLAFVGTPESIADEMEQWLVEEGSDGFNVMFPCLPGGLDDFVDRVVPELQRRGLFRTDYEGTTLRDHLGLARPENRFFTAAGATGHVADVPPQVPTSSSGG